MLWIPCDGDWAVSEKPVTLEDQKKYKGNFVGDDDKLYLVNCAYCKRENYALMVASGICAWCGWEDKKD